MNKKWTAEVLKERPTIIRDPSLMNPGLTFTEREGSIKNSLSLRKENQASCIDRREIKLWTSCRRDEFMNERQVVERVTKSKSFNPLAP